MAATSIQTPPRASHNPGTTPRPPTGASHALPRTLTLAALSLPLLLPAQTRTPVLVELFTSEGCSSCPPADALLARLEHEQPVAGAEVIVLEEHVDYWDSLGWRDRFSSPLMTERQRQYSTHFHLNDIYTPQMVVAGSTQFVGSDDRAAAKAIVQAARSKTYPLDLTNLHMDGKRILAQVTVPPHPGGVQPQADVYAALVSPHQSTAVRAGENGGRTLQHVGVVRSLVHIGDAAALNKAPLTVSFDTQGIPGPLRLVVFAQATGNGPILGAVAHELPTTPDPSKTTATLAP